MIFLKKEYLFIFTYNYKVSSYENESYIGNWTTITLEVNKIIHSDENLVITGY
ncbi:hypothetical protein ACIQYG_20955 [Peribacillus sp. NPDC096622]|uniref:hypothetical protein n=1 Tax=Peribacillus sp. NPDC096622 TaxID=3364396 RepID=UPI0037F6065D